MGAWFGNLRISFTVQLTQKNEPLVFRHLSEQLPLSSPHSSMSIQSSVMNLSKRKQRHYWKRENMCLNTRKSICIGHHMSDTKEVFLWKVEVLHFHFITSCTLFKCYLTKIKHTYSTGKIQIVSIREREPTGIAKIIRGYLLRLSVVSLSGSFHLTVLLFILDFTISNVMNIMYISKTCGSQPKPRQFLITGHRSIIWDSKDNNCSCGSIRLLY